MPTNEESREIAARLRYVGEHGAPEWATTACCIAECIGEDDYPIWESSAPLFGKLADLIDHEPERTCRMIDNGCELCCSLCDTRHDYDDQPNYCMGCGAKVVNDAD